MPNSALCPYEDFICVMVFFSVFIGCTVSDDGSSVVTEVEERHRFWGQLELYLALGGGELMKEPAWSGG